MIQEATILKYSVITSLGKYYFSVISDLYGNISVSEVKRGTSTHNENTYPQAVHTAIQNAISKLENIMSSLSNFNGSVSLTNNNEGSVIFSTPTANTEYRVLFSIDDFIPVRVKNRTTTGFTFELGSNFTGVVRYDVIL